MRRPTVAGLEELHRAGKHLDSALTDVMRAAFAAQRAEIGARGYDDRIYRRKAMATPPVRRLDHGGGAAAHPAGEPPADRHRPAAEAASRAPGGLGEPAAATDDRAVVF